MILLFKLINKYEKFERKKINKIVNIFFINYLNTLNQKNYGSKIHSFTFLTCKKKTTDKQSVSWLYTITFLEHVFFIKGRFFGVFYEIFMLKICHFFRFM